MSNSQTGAVRAAPSTRVDALHSGTVDVTLDRADALGVGYSLKVLARDGKMPPETAAIYERVAGQLVAAARREMAAAK